MTASADGDILIEIVRMGNAFKVSAIDAKTGTEVSTIGPLQASEAQLTKAAIAKLRYVLARNKEADKSPF